METEGTDVWKSTQVKGILERMIEENRDLLAEIADFVALLQEVGISSYKLTGSLQEPIITRYSIS